VGVGVTRADQVDRQPGQPGLTWAMKTPSSSAVVRVPPRPWLRKIGQNIRALAQRRCAIGGRSAGPEFVWRLAGDDAGLAQLGDVAGRRRHAAESVRTTFVGGVDSVTSLPSSTRMKKSATPAPHGGAPGRFRCARSASYYLKGRRFSTNKSPLATNGEDLDLLYTSQLGNAG
jgi:hypothetical protein